MLWPRKNKADNFDHKPVGSLPFAQAPRCGLYRTALTDAPPGPHSGPLKRLHASLCAEIGEEAVKQQHTWSPYDLLSVSSAVDPLSTAVENSVNLVATNRTIATTVRFTYHVDNNFIIASSQPKRVKRKTVAFFFPFSECGPNIESFEAKINGVPLFGEVLRARRSDGRLIPSHEKCKTAFLGETSEVSDDDEVAAREISTQTKNTPQTPQEAGLEEGDPAPTAADGAPGRPVSSPSGEKLLYYFVASDIQLTMYLPLRVDTPPPDADNAASPASHNGSTAPSEKNDTRGSLANTTPFHVEVSWRCRNTTSDVVDPRDHHMRVVYSLYCTPRYPDYVSLHAQLNPGQRIRVIRCPNCRGGVTLRATIEGAVAKAHAETVLGDPLRQYRLPGDYLFVFEVFLGDMPKVFEEVNKWGAAALLVVIAYLVWFFLTRDLIL